MSNLDFGAYCEIEQKRFGCDSEMYEHKVIGRMLSNCYVDVPVQTPPKERLHDYVVLVISCIRCGVVEEDVRKYRVEDVKPINK